MYLATSRNLPEHIQPTRNQVSIQRVIDSLDCLDDVVVGGMAFPLLQIGHRWRTNWRGASAPTYMEVDMGSSDCDASTHTTWFCRCSVLRYSTNVCRRGSWGCSSLLRFPPPPRLSSISSTSPICVRFSDPFLFLSYPTNFIQDLVLIYNSARLFWPCPCDFVSWELPPLHCILPSGSTAYPRWTLWLAKVSCCINKFIVLHIHWVAA